MVNPSAEDVAMIAQLRAEEPAGLPAFGLVLRITDAAGERYVPVDRDAWSLGTAGSNSVILEAPGVAPHHLKAWRGASAMMTRAVPDQLVRASQINGVPFTGIFPEGRLCPGDAVRLGEATVEVALDGSDAPMEGDFCGLVGRSRGMAQLYLSVLTVARNPIPVLIQGASGTGKESVAHAVHEFSDRKGKPFVPLNCGGLKGDLIEAKLFGHAANAFTGAGPARPGLFEEAHLGTLFLDEIGDLPSDTQARLLRVLENGEVMPVGSTRSRQVDVRIVAASNVDLARAAGEGDFREDLYYRLNGETVQVPSLNERRDDLLRLVTFLIAKHAIAGRSYEVSDGACQKLRSHTFPGNVRELSMVLRSAINRCGAKDTLTEGDIRIRSAARGNSKDPVEEVRTNDEDWLNVRGLKEADIILETRKRAIRRNGGNKTLAADELGVSRSTLKKLRV